MRATTNALGKKFLQVMEEKSLGQDFVAVAEAFGVKVPSVYDWIDHGRLSKERYPDLVAWSGHSLDWWFDIPESHAMGAKEPVASYKVPTAQLPRIVPDWPLPSVSPAEWAGLPDDLRREVDSIARGIVVGWNFRAGAATEKRTRQRA